jgi:hypothetical protein
MGTPIVFVERRLPIGAQVASIVAIVATAESRPWPAHHLLLKYDIDQTKTAPKK